MSITIFGVKKILGLDIFEKHLYDEGVTRREITPHPTDIPLLVGFIPLWENPLGSFFVYPLG